MRQGIDFRSIAEWLMELSDTSPVRILPMPPGTIINFQCIITLVQGNNNVQQAIFDCNKHFPTTSPEECQQQAHLPGQTPATETAERYPPLPPELATPTAMKLWRRTQRQGWVDEHYQPVKLTRKQSAVLASEMARILDLKAIWKPFEQLWHRNQMAADRSHADDSKENLKWQDVLKATFKGV